MKFVLAPDSFKGSMSSVYACSAMEKGIKKVLSDVNIIKMPMADGGEGTVDAFVIGNGGKKIDLDSVDPFGRKISASIGILKDEKTAVIEMSSTCGLYLIKEEERNILKASSYGTGVLIKKVLDLGFRDIIIGLGGSGTNDGGIGMMCALGVKFLNSVGNEIKLGAEEICDISRIDLSNLDERIKETSFNIACDVNNPLIGKNGASYVFGPQKGASLDEVEFLDDSLNHFGKVILKQFGKDIRYIQGSGAAGGMGASVLFFLNGKFNLGVDLISKYNNLEYEISTSDYVFTGEGCVDGQTSLGKTPYGIGLISKKYNVPVICFAGKIKDDLNTLYDNGITSVVPILSEVVSLKEALEMGYVNLQRASENISRIINANRNSI